MLIGFMSRVFFGLMVEVLDFGMEYLVFDPWLGHIERGYNLHMSFFTQMDMVTWFGG